MSFVYLAHPIDQAGESSWLGSFLATLNTQLVLAKVGAFRPGTAYLANTGDPGHARQIDELNNVAIYSSDAMVAVLLKDVATLGTPVEIHLAIQMNKPVVIFTDIAHSVQLAAWTRQGVTVYDIGAYDWEWPTADQLNADLQRKPRPDEPEDAPGVPSLLVTGEAANLQRGKYTGDAGIDLALAHNWSLGPGEYLLLPTGVHVAIPDGYWGLITGRSSAWAKHRVDVRQAVIDPGYRGELMVGVENRSGEVRHFDAGDRLAQLVILPAFGGEIELVDDLPDAERGFNGYGSSDAPCVEVG